MQLVTVVSNDIKTTNDGLNSVLCTSVLDDIAVSPEQVTVQPGNIVFPVTYFSGKGRSFNPAWFRLHRWLEYSVKLDRRLFMLYLSFIGSNGGGSSS